MVTFTKPSASTIRILLAIFISILLLFVFYNFFWSSKEQLQDDNRVVPTVKRPSSNGGSPTSNYRYAVATVKVIPPNNGSTNDAPSTGKVSSSTDNKQTVTPDAPPNTASSSSAAPLTNKVPSSVNTVITSSSSSTLLPADRYPSTFEKIWIEIDQHTLLRRTAYYDTRPHFGRSVILISFHDDLAERQFPQLYAKVTMSDGTSFCSPVDNWKTNGEVITQWHDVALNHVIRVHLNEHTGVPKTVQVSKNSECSQQSLFPEMTIFYDKRPQDGTVFATCIQKALYGTISPDILIDFIELNKFLGATYITVYFSRDLKNPDELLRAATPYINSGLVEIIDWRITQARQDWWFDQGMSGSASECIYRNLHRARYMALHDIDEYLIPRNHLKWIDFLEELKKQTDISKYASFAFANALFSMHNEPFNGFGTSTQCKPPVFYVRKLRNGNPEREHPKVMLDLDTTITAYCHDIKTWKDGLQKLYWVPNDVGLLHHYRKNTDGGRGDGMKWIHDNVMDNYTQYIVPILKKRC